MVNNIYEKLKLVFLDTVDIKNYVQPDRTSTLYQSLKETVKKPLKMILLYGKPGTGKSMLLAKLHNDLLAQKYMAYLYQTPLVDEREFLSSLASDLYKTKYKGTLNFTQFMSIAKQSPAATVKDVPIILLDEAQMYPVALMEKIRLLSDARVVKFVIVLHKTDEEDILAKEHFQTRIWESIEIENATNMEIKAYIQKKIMKANYFDIANMFDDKTAKLIWKFTHGNYRQTNKLIYSLFDIYSWYEENQKYKLINNHIPAKYIEMAAIQTGLLHV